MKPITEAREAFYGGKPTERRTATFEVRTLATPPELGAAPVAERVGLYGYAATTESPYKVTDWLGEYTETITRGAFTKALQERDDVRLLVNHEGVPVARTKSGTMALREDEHGLLVDVPELDTTSPLVQTLRSAMARGDVDEMSFAFRATRQEWNEDYTERWVREVKLFDVSVVTYPANDTTSAKLRSGLPFQTLDRLAAGEPLTEADYDALRAVLPEPVTVGDSGEEAHVAEIAAERRLARLRTIARSL